MAARGVVVVGAGQGGLDTVASLRAKGYAGPVALVGDEPVLPYQRPPLSKGFVSGTVTAEELTLRTESFFEGLGITPVLGDRALTIDLARQAVQLASGAALGYDKLVLATGARPRTLPLPGMGLAGVLTLRTLADAEKLRRGLTGPARRVVLIGAGFIGLELASTARSLGHHVTVVEAQPRVLARALTPQMASWLAARHRAQGVRLLLGREVTALRAGASGRVGAVALDGSEQLSADLVVIGVGVLPHCELAAGAGLVVDDGIVVDQHLRTSDRAVYALGDCARFPSPHLGRATRLESVQNASDQARCVAAAICGEPAPYTAVPSFWSEQYDLRLQIAGVTAGHEETVTVGDPDEGRFSVFCFHRGRLGSVESVNKPADHAIARRLLGTGTDLSPHDVRQPGFDLKKLARTSATASPSPRTHRPTVHA
ncbi:FAD-dependent oxidoreductase [Streptomyces sp. NPDC020362]|uniref:NAD(P)/FAD-dependent oxidoreductase n=1 Tax=unclassified Streptomyces TaxID=2593676 RepID=UPI000AB93942